MSLLLNNLVSFLSNKCIQKFIFNCCSQDSTKSGSDCTLGKHLINDNKISPKIQLEDVNNGVNKEEDKVESFRMENSNKKEDVPIPTSGFKRTKTKHFK